VIHVCAYHFSQELWHRYAAAQQVVLDHSFTLELVLTALVFMLVASELNYRFIEQPLRRKGAKIASRRLQQFTGSRGDGGSSAESIGDIAIGAEGAEAKR
jgi:peptidoglycan/LPS O-acetylase OafA/YrhL